MKAKTIRKPQLKIMCQNKKCGFSRILRVDFQRVVSIKELHPNLGRRLPMATAPCPAYWRLDLIFHGRLVLLCHFQRSDRPSCNDKAGGWKPRRTQSFAEIISPDNSPFARLPAGEWIKTKHLHAPIDHPSTKHGNTEMRCVLPNDCSTT